MNILEHLKHAENVRPTWHYTDEVLGRLSVTAHAALTDAIVTTLTSAIDTSHNGLTRCECGGKYWLQGRCFDCGAALLDAVLAAATQRCMHCDRVIVLEDGRWVDPQATGDDSVWRETCDMHDTFVAEHEPMVTS